MPQRHEMEPRCVGVPGLSSFLNIIITLFITFKIYLDVDCSTITYETEPSNSVWSAVEKAKADVAISSNNATHEEILDRC